jgi:hypothetical protein
MRDGKNSRTFVKLMWVDAEGRMLLDVERMPVGVLEIARLAPAYDDDALGFISRYEKAGGDRKVEVATIGINLWDKATFVERSGTLQKGSPISITNGGQLKFSGRSHTENLPYAEGRWAHPDTLANAVALSADALLVAEAVSWSANKSAWQPAPPEGLLTITGWQLTAYRRADGKKSWSVPLPGEPLMNGIAIARDGKVVVTLRDGSLVAIAP